MSRTLATKKTKKKKKGKKRSPASTEGSPGVSKSPGSSNPTAIETDASKSSEMSKKAQCDLCKLSYSTEKELTEHLLSIMHHTKMEDKEEKPVHSCTLCSITCSNMAEYRVHVTTDIHQQKLSRFKGDYDKNPVNKKGKQPPWRNKKHFNHKSKHGVFQGYKKQSMDTHKKINIKSLGFTSQSQYDNSTSSRGFSFGQRHRSALYQYTNGTNCWSQEQFSSETGDLRMPPSMNNMRNISDKRSQSGIQPISQYPQQWGSGAYGFPHQYHSSEGISLPWKVDRRPQKWGTSFANQKEVLKQPKHPPVRDFASSTIPEAWDEQSLLQHEQYLASMDDVYFTGSQYPSQQLSTSYYHSERQRGPNVQDRKSLKRGDNHLMQDTFAETSRSVDVSPVKEFPRRQQVPCISEERSHKAAKVQSFGKNIHTLIPSSNNSIHERARNFAKELKEKQHQAFQVDKNLLKSKHTISGKEVVSLPDKQQSHHKGDPNISGSKHSNISIPLTVKHSRHMPTESAASALQQSSHGISLDDIRKSIEQSVLDNSKEPQTKTVSKVNRKRCLSESIEPAATIDNKGDTAGKSQSKRVCKPQLTTDSIKKIINAPNSRDERLQLSRMLQSRGEHKIAASNLLRTNVQLEGVHDSIIISEDVNPGGNQKSSVQTIKLEDLSDSVRHQILSLIGEDVASFAGSQADLEVNKVRRENHTVQKIDNSNTHIIFLSDDEDVINAAEIDKNISQKCSSNSTPGELIKNATKAKKKKIVISEPVSKSGLYRSALPSVNRALMSASSSVKYSDNHETAKLTEMLATNHEGVLNADVDINLSSCSTSMKLHRGKKLSGNKSVSDSVKTQLDKGKVSGCASLNNEESLSCRQTELSVDKNDRRPTNSWSPTKELQACVKSPSIRKKMVKTHKTDDSSEISSSSQCSKLTPHEMPCHIPDAPLISSSIQRTPKSSTQQAHIKVKSTSKGAVVKSSSTQVEVVSSSLHADTRLSPSLDRRVRSSSPDTGSDSSLLLTTQQHSTETTLSLSSPNAAKSNRLTLPPSTWLRGRISPPKESLSSSSLNASTSNSTSGLITVITDDEDDSDTESKQLPDKEVKDLTQLPGTSEQEGMSLSDRFDDSKIISTFKPSLPFSLFKDEDKSEMATTVIGNNDNHGERSEQLPDSEVSNSTLSVSTLQRDSISTADTCNNHSSSGPALPSVLKAVKVKANSEMVAITVDEDSVGAGDKLLPDSGLDNEVSTDVTEDASEMVTTITSERVTTLTSGMLTAVTDDDDNSGMGCEQLLDSEVSNSTLPVSTLPRDSISTADICENDSSSGPALPSVLKAVKVEATSEMVTTVTDDEDSGGTGDKQLPDSGMDNEVSADITEFSANVMSELLMLSEREEDIKQEKMSLDLRLSRLHKLLEQAVLQINKCTERRKQLHDGEQALARQRLSLLREATALRPHKTSSTADVEPASNCDSEDRTHVSNTSQPVAQNLATNRYTVPCPSVAPTSVVGSSTNENPQVASLSRDDWLAKFSSYLPCGGAGEDPRLVRTRNISNPTTLKEVFHCSSIPVALLRSMLPSDALVKERGSHPSQTAGYVIKTPQTLVIRPAIDPSFLLTSKKCDSVNNKSDGNLQFQDVGSGQNSSDGAAPTRPLPENVTMSPVMYLRSIRQTDAVVSENIQIGSFSE